MKNFLFGIQSVSRRYRFMAIWAGVMSLLLWFVYMPVKYIIANENWHENLIWIPIVHGFTYPIYVLAALNLGLIQRRNIFQIAFLAVAGTLPFASFWAERKLARQSRTQSH
jgi:integral membrane protein